MELIDIVLAKVVGNGLNKGFEHKKRLFDYSLKFNVFDLIRRNEKRGI